MSLMFQYLSKNIQVRYGYLITAARRLIITTQMSTIYDHLLLFMN